jgi:hypothetical protein
MEERKPKQANLLGPVLLIGIGTVLLLNTLGIVEWSIWWTILRLWPVLLIAAGLDLLLGRYSIWGSVLAVVLIIAVVAGALWFSATGPEGMGGVAAQEIRQTLDGATEAEVRIDPGVGVLRIGALPESANLIEGTIRLRKSEEVSQEYSQSSGNARFALETTQGEPWTPFFSGPDERRAWELGLSPAPYLDLRASLGLGDVQLDLRKLALRDLRANMGIGLMEITLPESGGYEAKVDSAIGVTTILIPEGPAVRIHVDTGIATREIPEGYQEEGENTYLSPGYASTADKAVIYVSQPIGVVRIRRVE